MAAFDNNHTFSVHYVLGSDLIETILTISTTQIVCPLIPTITFNALKEILCRKKAFGFVLDGNTFEFVAKDKAQRDLILKQIHDAITRHISTKAERVKTCQTKQQKCHVDDDVVANESTLSNQENAEHLQSNRNLQIMGLMEKIFKIKGAAEKHKEKESEWNMERREMRDEINALKHRIAQMEMEGLGHDVMKLKSQRQNADIVPDHFQKVLRKVTPETAETLCSYKSSSNPNIDQIQQTIESLCYKPVKPQYIPSFPLTPVSPVPECFNCNFGGHDHGYGGNIGTNVVPYVGTELHVGLRAKLDRELSEVRQRLAQGLEAEATERKRMFSQLDRTISQRRTCHLGSTVFNSDTTQNAVFRPTALRRYKSLRHDRASARHAQDKWKHVSTTTNHQEILTPHRYAYNKNMRGQLTNLITKRLGNDQVSSLSTKELTQAWLRRRAAREAMCTDLGRNM